MSGPPFDLAVRGGRFLNPAGAQVPEGGSLLVRDGAISGFGAPGEAPCARQTIDATGRLIIPGLVNAHTHAAMSLFRGLVPDGLALADWLARIWAAEAAAVSPEMVYWCSLLSCCEMLLSGTTLFGDGYFFEEEVGRAAERAGIRAVCGQGVLDVATPDAAAGRGLVRLEEFLEGFRGSALVRPAVFCHSVYTCSPATLAAAWGLARAHGCLFFSHVAETAAEVRQCVRAHGTTPLRLLGRLGILGEGCVVVHGVHLDEGEAELLAASGAAAVHCPESNMKLAAGIAPVGLMLERGVRLALGTDSAASNDDQDLLRETAAAARLQRLSGAAAGWPRAAAMLRMATAGGADALGHNGGVLEEGRAADLAILEPRQPHLWPPAPTQEGLAEQLVFCTRGADVRTVIVGGEVVVEEGRPTKVDVAEVMARVREMAERS